MIDIFLIVASIMKIRGTVETIVFKYILPASNRINIETKFNENTNIIQSDLIPCSSMKLISFDRIQGG